MIFNCLARYGLALTIALCVACQREMEERLIPLDQNWQFTQADNEHWLDAVVPGCVHTDLLASGLIPDPFHRFNEDSVQWIEREDWVYRLFFEVDASTLSRRHVELVFEGLDTYADVYLNEQLILQADNMFLSWNVEVKPFLVRGVNELKVYFHSPVRKGLEKLRQLPYILKVTNELAPEAERSNVFTRKAPFHYGWDWGPRLVSSGIWRPVYLRAWDDILIRDVFFEPIDVDTERALYHCRLTVQAGEPGEVEIELALDGKEMVSRLRTLEEAGEQEITLELEIDKPRLWWTHQLGEPYRYEVDINIRHEKGARQQLRRKLGVRRIELVQPRDSIGRGFFFRLNGLPIFAKGANYIPSDIFVARQDEQTYRRVLEDAVRANMNMLRVWGGAIYENDLFYELCDEYGLLVWQDFMFACALTPGDEEYLENVRAEAEYNVRRLRNFACMALWCGNNENLVAWHKWGWKESYQESHRAEIWNAYENIFHKILPDAVKKYHPQLSYWPSSPQSYGNVLPDRRSGDEHDWTVWFAEAPFHNYANDPPRFVSEYGMQSFPDLATIAAFAAPEDLHYRSPVMEHRQRSKMRWIAPDMNGNEMIRRYLERYYRPAEDFESFVYLSQLSQALGMKTAAEAHRGAAPRCMGSLYWQINDCWPTMSWSSVDYFGRWKASHHAFKRAFAPVAPIVVEEGDELMLRVASDERVVRGARLTLRLLSFEGAVLWRHEQNLAVRSNTTAEYWRMKTSDLLAGQNRRRVLLHVRLEEEGASIGENIFYFERPKDLELSDPGLRAEVSGEAGRIDVVVRAERLAKDVFLSFGDVKGNFSDNFFDLLPGEERRVSFITTEPPRDPRAALRVLTLFDVYKQEL